MEQNNKSGAQAANQVPSVIGQDTVNKVCLQSVLDRITDKEGLSRQTLWRGYQLGDGGNETWKYVEESKAVSHFQMLEPMFAGAFATTYRKDSPDVPRGEGLALDHYAFFDFDCPDLTDAISTVRRFIGKLTDDGADANALHIFASGSKGFHVLVPLEMFLPNGVNGLGIKDVSAFHMLIKELAQVYYVEGLDLRVYTAQRQWRRAGVKRSNGAYKVPISFTELMGMDADAYAAAVAAPRDEIQRATPELSSKLALEWIKARDKVAGDLLVKKKRAAARAALPPPTGDEIDRFKDALFAIDPDANGYEDWRNCLMAIHAAFDGSDTGLNLAHDWSRQGAKYDAKALDASWDCLMTGINGGITSATVFKLARESGWRDPRPDLNPRNQIDSPQYRLRETDEGFAEHVAAKYGERLRFVQELKAWAAFDGRSWIIEHGIVTAKALAKAEIRDQAARVLATPAEDEKEEAARKKSLSFAIGLENGRKLETLVGKLADLPALSCSVSVFDDRPYLLNLPNGVYDLERDEMRAHSPDDFLTQRMHVDRDPNAKAPRWLRFIDEVTQGNKELADYLQRIAGLCLSGDVSRQEAYILYGSGANGKSVFTSMLRELLGDYFKPLAVEALVYSSKPGQNQTELAALRGARAVATSELDRGVQLRSGQFKDLTGGDAMQVSDKYVKAFTLKPQCTILVPTNFLPTVTQSDNGTWRRICIIPFDAYFPTDKRDPLLLEKLRAELPGILNWAIEGFRKFRTQGWEVPTAVQALTMKYRDELDISKNFVNQWLIQDEAGREDRGRLSIDDLYTLYVLYCRSCGLKSPLTKRAFKEDMGRLGMEHTLKARQPVYWDWRIRAEYVPENVMAERFGKAAVAARALHVSEEIDD